MIYTIYPQFDATLYEDSVNKNTGIDSILELSHTITGTGSKYNSRLVMKFDVSDVESRVNSGKISQNAKYYLSLRTADATEIPQEYVVYAYPISGSWVNGTGKYFNTPVTTDGVSWKYRTSKATGVLWDTTPITSSFQWDEVSDTWIQNDNFFNFGELYSQVTSSFTSEAGGGTWWTWEGTECTQSFSYETSDLYMDISPIVNKWITGSGRFDNNGLIIKFSNSLENSEDSLPSLKFFSSDSNTIYVPRMFIVWDDSEFVTGSLTEATYDNMAINVRLKKTYLDTEKAKIRVHANKRYPDKSYTTQSYYTQNYFLPSSSYYEIRDAHTDEIVIPFDVVGTKLSCDSDGNFFNMWMNAFQPERYYRVVIKTETDGGDISQVFDNQYYFKVSQ